jgi:2-oxo-4-hydroxy-4-carboxy-5-ureidoimidazoline decarboxylase
LGITISDLNAMDRAAFVATLGRVFEHSPRAPSATHGEADRQLALLRAHPELAGKAAVRGELTPDSTQEQSGAGLNQCSPAESARLRALNAAYNAKFGFPFILAVKGYDRAGILREFARRLECDRDTEFAEALAQTLRIARFRLDVLFAG